MSQKSITSFFKPLTPTKRSSSDNASPPEVDRPKKQKLGESPSVGNCKFLNVDNDSILKSRLNSMCKSNKALHPSIGLSWYRALLPEFSKSYFKKLGAFIALERDENTVYPPEEDVYTWTKMFPIEKTKVVILGQDPYHGPRQAHGLCFSVKHPVPPPPSLLNIFKELRSDIDGFFEPSHGDLSGWARQGVLLLNAVLTVRAHNANSHSGKGWEQLTDAVMRYLNTNCKNLVFLLWGQSAQKKGAIIDRKKHLVLETVHPSPLSAHRGFIGCKHFSKANEYLKSSGKEPIDWTDLSITKP